MKNLTRNVWICLGLIMFPLTTFGQQKNNFTYVPAQELLLVGKATIEGEYFHRVDTAKYCTMPPAVKKLFTNSAGLAISFTTNSPVIKAKWTVPDNYQLPNLTRLAQKGLDLYIKRDGKWQFAGVGMPGGVTTERVIVDNREPVDASMFVISEKSTLGIISDVDDTIMVTQAPSPLRAAYNLLIMNPEHRHAVKGMNHFFNKILQLFFLNERRIFFRCLFFDFISHL